MNIFEIYPASTAFTSKLDEYYSANIMQDGVKKYQCKGDGGYSHQIQNIETGETLSSHTEIASFTGENDTSKWGFISRMFKVMLTYHDIVFELDGEELCRFCQVLFISKKVQIDGERYRVKNTGGISSSKFEVQDHFQLELSSPASHLKIYSEEVITEWAAVSVSYVLWACAKGV